MANNKCGNQSKGMNGDTHHPSIKYKIPKIQWPLEKSPIGMIMLRTKKQSNNIGIPGLKLTTKCNNTFNIVNLQPLFNHLFHSGVARCP